MDCGDDTLACAEQQTSQTRSLQDKDDLIASNGHASHDEDGVPHERDELSQRPLVAPQDVPASVSRRPSVAEYSPISDFDADDEVNNEIEESVHPIQERQTCEQAASPGQSHANTVPVTQSGDISQQSVPSITPVSQGMPTDELNATEMASSENEPSLYERTLTRTDDVASNLQRMQPETLPCMEDTSAEQDTANIQIDSGNLQGPSASEPEQQQQQTGYETMPLVEQQTSGQASLAEQDKVLSEASEYSKFKVETLLQEQIVVPRRASTEDDAYSDISDASSDLEFVSITPAQSTHPSTGRRNSSDHMEMSVSRVGSVDTTTSLVQHSPLINQQTFGTHYGTMTSQRVTSTSQCVPQTSQHIPPTSQHVLPQTSQHNPATSQHNLTTSQRPVQVQTNAAGQVVIDVDENTAKEIMNKAANINATPMVLYRRPSGNIQTVPLASTSLNVLNVQQPGGNIQTLPLTSTSLNVLNVQQPGGNKQTLPLTSTSSNVLNVQQPGVPTVIPFNLQQPGGNIQTLPLTSTPLNVLNVQQPGGNIQTLPIASTPLNVLNVQQPGGNIQTLPLTSTSSNVLNVQQPGVPTVIPLNVQGSLHAALPKLQMVWNPNSWKASSVQTSTVTLPAEKTQQLPLLQRAPHSNQGATVQQSLPTQNSSPIEHNQQQLPHLQRKRHTLIRELRHNNHCLCRNLPL
ncbi:uncharacterized protein [Amphiura filiformis]|uniref:uncharacterized protein n=1 Tax=Amphiura filiformis TaxID=82378 RepID=UPI003B212DF6